MHIGVEIEVLLNAQIVIKAEPLRHVADAVLDGLRIGLDVDAQHAELARIGG